MKNRVILLSLVTWLCQISVWAQLEVDSLGSTIIHKELKLSGFVPPPLYFALQNTEEEGVIPPSYLFVFPMRLTEDLCIASRYPAMLRGTAGRG